MTKAMLVLFPFLRRTTNNRWIYDCLWFFLFFSFLSLTFLLEAWSLPEYVKDINILLYISSKIKFAKARYSNIVTKNYMFFTFEQKYYFNTRRFKVAHFLVWDESVEEWSKKIKFFRLECKLTVDVASNSNWIRNSCDKKNKFYLNISEE